MEKKNKDSDGGYMTVFSCLLFLVMMSLIFLCLDGIMIYQGDSKSQVMAVGAGEHILANYNVPLAKRYHLYFLDSEMENKIPDRVKKYYENMLISSSAGFFKNNSLLDLKVKEIQAESFGTMQEQNCLYLRKQIQAYMKYDSTKNLLLNRFDRLTEQMNGQNREIRDMKELLGQKEAAASQAKQGQDSPSSMNSSETKSLEQAAARARKNDPRKAIQKIIKSGVLAFVTEEKSISEKYISPISLPSGSQKEKKLDFSSYSFGGIKTIKNLLKETKTNGLAQHSLTCAYIKKHFNSYTKEERIENTVLEYEMEYIIGGQDSDRENLQYTVNRLVLMRFAMNCVYALKDPELNSQALTMATALVGITGLVPVIEGVKYTILGAVSFGEALIDVKSLVAGKKVPIIKTKTDWNLSVSGAAAGLEKDGGHNEKGLSYEEYLMLLLLSWTGKNRMYLRMQDLMQVNICQEQPGFQIEKCRFGFRMEGATRIKTWFGHGSYDFTNNRTFSY